MAKVNSSCPKTDNNTIHKPTIKTDSKYSGHHYSQNSGSLAGKILRVAAFATLLFPAYAKLQCSDKQMTSYDNNAEGQLKLLPRNSETLLCRHGTKYLGFNNESLVHNDFWEYNHITGKEQYFGNLKDGQRNGWGGSIKENGKNDYDGDWKAGYKHGKRGISSYDGTKIEYDGPWQKGKWHGKDGEWRIPEGTMMYKGDYEKGKRHGQGRSYYVGGAPKYVGGWSNDKRHGIGTLYWPGPGEREKYVGEWQDGKPHGFGSFYREDGSLAYEGYLEEGISLDLVVQNGQKKYIRQDGTIVYPGEWKKYEKQVKGILFEGDAKVYSGEWINGENHEEGISFDGDANAETSTKEKVNLENDKVEKVLEFGENNEDGILSIFRKYWKR